MLKKFKISSILVTYAITAIVVLAVICVIFSFSILSINGNVNNMYDTAVVSQSELKTVQTNLMNIGNNYMLLFVERNFDTVASRLGEIDAWTAEDKEILNAYNESGIEGEYLDSYTALQNALAPYRETRGYMDELLKANDFDGAYHYYITFEAQRETVDDAIAHLCDVNGGLGQILVDQSAKTLKTTFIGIFAIIIILSVILISESVLIVRFIKSELKKSVDLAGSLAEGVIEMPKGLKFEENPRNELVILDNAFYELIENSQKQAETLEGIAAGAIDADVNVRSGKDTLNLSMKKVVDTLKALQDSLLNTAKAIDAGNSSYRPDADEFSGGYKDIVNGVNRVIDIWDSQVGDLAANIASLGEGRLPDVDTNRAGDFGTLFTQFESTVNSIRSLVQDTQAMANAALAGDYSVRADVDKYQGDYKSVIDGINKTLDMVVDKTNWYSNIIDSFPLPVQVMDVNQNWTLINETFMQILRGAGIAQRADELLGKKCYLSVAEINGVPTLLTKGQNEMQFEWNGGVIKQTTGYIKNTKGETIGYVGSMQNLTAVVREAEYNEAAAMRLQRNLETMARGDFASLEDNNIPTNPFTTAAEGRFNAIDDALGLVIESIRGMIEDSIEMANNAIAGNLDKRAALDRYQGDYQKVMKGLNDTVDALTAPLSEIIDVLESVGEGDLSRKVTGNYSGDLIKSKEAINATTDNLQRIIAEISELLEAIGQGDLTVHAKETYNGDFSAIKKSLEDIEDGLKDVMTGINKSSELVAGGSKQLSEGAQNLAQGSTKQAAAVQQLSSTMKQVADQTKQNTEDARKASEMSTDVMHKAEKGNAQMKDMLQSMADINESSSNISKIIKVIDDIAFQTNILALNAAVEAARAGVHGKGFAVVADEVRNLAAKSAAAASETTALIEGSIANVEAGTKIANETAEALGEIVAGITETSNLCDAIADVSDEQYKGILEVNRGIEDVSKVIQSNSATAEESAASSQELYSQANNLKKLVAQFKLESGSRTLNGPQYASAAAKSDERALPEITLDISMGGFDGSDKY